MNEPQEVTSYMCGAVGCPSLEMAERYATNLSAGKRIEIKRRTTTITTRDETLFVYENGKKLPHGE